MNSSFPLLSSFLGFWICWVCVLMLKEAVWLQPIHCVNIKDWSIQFLFAKIWLIKRNSFTFSSPCKNLPLSFSMSFPPPFKSQCTQVCSGSLPLSQKPHTTGHSPSLIVSLAHTVFYLSFTKGLFPSALNHVLISIKLWKPARLQRSLFRSHLAFFFPPNIFYTEILLLQYQFLI